MQNMAALHVAVFPLRTNLVGTADVLSQKYALIGTNKNAAEAPKLVAHPDFTSDSMCHPI